MQISTFCWFLIAQGLSRIACVLIIHFFPPVFCNGGTFQDTQFGFFSGDPSLILSSDIYSLILFFWQPFSASAFNTPKLNATNPFISVLSKPIHAESVSISTFLDLLTWTRHPLLDHIPYEQGVLGQHKLDFHTGYVTAPGRDPQTLQYCSVQNLIVTKPKANKF